jgi:hypothetical protein
VGTEELEDEAVVREGGWEVVQLIGLEPSKSTCWLLDCGCEGSEGSQVSTGDFLCDSRRL